MSATVIADLIERVTRLEEAHRSSEEALRRETRALQEAHRSSEEALRRETRALEEAHRSSEEALRRETRALEGRVALLERTYKALGDKAAKSFESLTYVAAVEYCSRYFVKEDEVVDKSSPYANSVQLLMVAIRGGKPDKPLTCPSAALGDKKLQGTALYDYRCQQDQNFATVYADFTKFLGKVDVGTRKSAAHDRDPTTLVDRVLRIQRIGVHDYTVTGFGGQLWERTTLIKILLVTLGTAEATSIIADLRTAPGTHPIPDGQLYFLQSLLDLSKIPDLAPMDQQQ